MVNFMLLPRGVFEFISLRYHIPEKSSFEKRLFEKLFSTVSDVPLPRPSISKTGRCNFGDFNQFFTLLRKFKLIAQRVWMQSSRVHMKNEAKNVLSIRNNVKKVSMLFCVYRMPQHSHFKEFGDDIFFQYVEYVYRECPSFGNFLTYF